MQTGRIWPSRSRLYPVRADVSNDDNNSPDFRSGQTARTISEDAKKGDAVGNAVMVSIDEDNDTLTYELDDDLCHGYYPACNGLADWRRKMMGTVTYATAVQFLLDRQGYGSDFG